MISPNSIQWITTREPPKGEIVREQKPPQHEQRTSCKPENRKKNSEQNYVFNEG